MQISGGEYKNANAFRTASLILNKEGPLGFFRGVGSLYIVSSYSLNLFYSILSIMPHSQAYALT